MKSLLVKDLPTFLKRFGNFVDGEFRDVQIISPTNIKVIIAAQDEARGFDWLTIEFEFYDVSNASLIDNNKLLHVDMSDGLNITHEDNNFIFKTNNATFQISSSSIKYQEEQF